MAINIQIDRKRTYSRVPLPIKVLSWLFILTVLSAALFGNNIQDVTLLLSVDWLILKKGIFSWVTLILTVIVLFVKRYKLIGNDYYYNDNHWMFDLLNKITSIDVIIFSLFILLAYPIPPLPEFTLFRFYILSIAVYILIFGRTNATIPLLLIFPNVLAAMIPLLSNI